MKKLRAALTVYSLLATSLVTAEPANFSLLCKNYKTREIGEVPQSGSPMTLSFNFEDGRGKFVSIGALLKGNVESTVETYKLNGGVEWKNDPPVTYALTINRSTGVLSGSGKAAQFPVFFVEAECEKVDYVDPEKPRQKF